MYTGKGRGVSTRCLTIIANGSRLSWAVISSSHSARSDFTQYATNSHLWMAMARNRRDTNASRDGYMARKIKGTGKDTLDINSGGAPGRIDESVNNKRRQCAHIPPTQSIPWAHCSDLFHRLGDLHGGHAAAALGEAQHAWHENDGVAGELQERRAPVRPPPVVTRFAKR